MSSMEAASSSKAAAESEPLRKDNLIRRRRKRAQIGKEGRVWLLWELLLAGAAVGVTAQLLFLAWWRPYLGVTGGATSLGVGAGLLYALLYSRNCKRKVELNQLLSMDPGLKGCQYLLGAVPGWIQLTDREKMEWLNGLLAEMWPFYDRGICTMVKDIVEPIMDYYKPPGIIKKIWFQELTFGDAPFRVEGITVKEDPEGIEMDVDVRWCGDANITLAVDLPAGGAFTRLTPKVRDIVFVATIKILLKPLVQKVPGFAAAAVALKTPPIIKYRLDFGMLPGGITSVITAPIVAFVNYLVNIVLVGMLLWPKRITVPLLSWNGFLPANDPDIDTDVERLEGRPQGVIKVSVIRAKDLKSFDVVTGKSDPFVEVFTTLDHRGKTRVIKNNLAPVWEEAFFLPVLEKDQVLRMEVFDHDAVNLTGAMTLQIWKAPGAVLDAKEFMARSAVPLADVIRLEGQEEEGWYALGRGEWTNLEGPGKGEGLIKVALEYRSLETIGRQDMSRAKKGLVVATVIRAFNLSAPGAAAPKSAATLKLGKETWTTPPLISENPRWSWGHKFTMYDVDLEKTPQLEIDIAEQGLGLSTIGLGDASLGSAVIPLQDVLRSCQRSRWTKLEQHGYWRKVIPLTGGFANAALELELEFLPNW